MAKNTGRGSLSANSASSRFLKAKSQGGSFRGVNRRPWWRHLLRRHR